MFCVNATCRMATGRMRSRPSGRLSTRLICSLRAGLPTIRCGRSAEFRRLRCAGAGVCFHGGLSRAWLCLAELAQSNAHNTPEARINLSSLNIPEATVTGHAAVPSPLYRCSCTRGLRNGTRWEIRDACWTDRRQAQQHRRPVSFTSASADCITMAELL